MKFNKNLSIIRQRSSRNGTPGTLRVQDTWWTCDTLELPWLNNRRGISCIYDGIYSCDLWFSPMLGRMTVRIEDKNGRKDCLIHNGNWAGDQTIDENKDGKPDLKTQIHGCIEVGRGYGMLDLPGTKVKQFGILSSAKTLAELVQHIGAGPHSLSIEWAEGEEPHDTTDLLGKVV